MSRARVRIAQMIAAATAVAALASCGTATPSTTGSAAASGTAITVSDPWVKAAKSGMTAAFVTLTNTSDTEQFLVSATTPASATVQLHEMVMSGGQMIMQQRRTGITVPAHGSAVLEPGGNHMMLMDITSMIAPGAEVPFTLTFASGTTLSFSAIAKDFTGAQESYQPSPSTPMSSST